MGIEAIEPLKQLLQVALGVRSALDYSLSEEEWERLYGVFLAHGLVGLGFKGIERLPKEQRPDIVQMLHWSGRAEIIRQKNEKANRLCEKVCRILQRHELHPSILKGQTLAKLYDYPECRQCGDIDVWCVPNGYEQAPLSVRRKRVVQLLRGYMTPKELESIVYHHMEFTSIEDVMVEVHFTPTWFFNPLYNQRLQRWFMGEPGALFNPVFVLLHIYRHLFAEGANLKQLTDYYFVLKHWHTHELAEGDERHRASALSEFKQTLGYLGLYRFLGAVEYCLQQVYALPETWLIVPVEERAGKVLLADILTHGSKKVYKDGTWKKFFAYAAHALKYLRFYPNEVLWMPVFKVYQFFWRKGQA